MLKYEYIDNDAKKPYCLLLAGKGVYEVEDVYSTNKNGEGYSATVKGKRHQAVMVKFLVHDKERRNEYVYDFIFHWKLKALLQSANAMALYSKGGMIDEKALIGLKGECVIGHEDKPPFGTKNKITEYLLPSEDFPTLADHLEHQKSLEQTQNADDDLPF